MESKFLNEYGAAAKTTLADELNYWIASCAEHLRALAGNMSPLDWAITGCIVREGFQNKFTPSMLNDVDSLQDAYRIGTQFRETFKMFLLAHNDLSAVDRMLAYYHVDSEIATIIAEYQLLKAVNSHRQWSKPKED